MNPLLQLRSQLALPLNRPQDRLLAFGQLTSLGHALRDATDVDLVEPTGLVTAVASDEGNGVPLIQQSDRGGHVRLWQPEPLGNLPEVDQHW